MHKRFGATLCLRFFVVYLLDFKLKIADFLSDFCVLLHFLEIISQNLTV